MINKIVGVSLIKNEEDIIASNIIHNTRVVDELIILDNQSTDQTPQICTELAKKYPITYIYDKTSDYQLIEKYEQHHTTPLEISCSRPFGEMNILHDGTITYCCHDGGVEYPLWHIDKGNLYFYWNHHPMLQYIRQQLYQYNRNHTLCQHCNYWGGEKQITTTTPSPYNNTPPPPSV